MTADEMFEGLGFKVCTDCCHHLAYKHQDVKNKKIVGEKDISFWKQSLSGGKQVAVYGMSVEMLNAYLPAINKKCEELGWS